MSRPSTPTSKYPFHPRRLWLGFGLLIAACALIGVAYAPQTHVTHRYGGAAHRAAWVWLDAAAILEHADQQGQFEGRVSAPDGESWRVENTLGADITLTVNGSIAYQGTASTEVTLPGGSGDGVAFALDYAVPETYPTDGHLAFMRTNRLGMQMVIPAWDYVPPDGERPLGNALGGLLRPLALVVGAAAIVVLIAALRLSRGSWLILALIVVLTLAVRLITLAQKLDNDPGLWTMDTIWDNYVIMGRGWLAGEVPVGGQVYQQGMFVYLGLLQMILGPDVQALYLFSTIAASASAVFLTLAGWSLFDRPTGAIAGLLAALFAPLIHYQHTLQIVSPATWLLFALVAMLAALARWPHPVFVLLAGIAIGLGTIFRNSILVMLALPLMMLVIQRGTTWRRRLLHVGLLLAAAAICIMPITVSNLRAGVVALTANLGDYQLFRSNNLNSTGMNTYKTQSEQLALARGDDWLDALRRELEREPLHAVELTVRRVALFWEAEEHSDSGMIDYRSTGLAVSPLLDALSAGGRITFRLAMTLALVGLGLGLADRARRAGTLLTGGALALYMLSLALFYVIGRVRMPAAPLVLLLAASGIAALAQLRRQPRRLATVALPVLAAALIITAGANALADSLPRPNVVRSGSLPPGLIRVEGTYDDQIRLLGYAYYDSNYTPGGYLTFELFWEALRQPEKDYVVSIRLVDLLSQQIEQTDNSVLGRLATPEHPASQWQQGDIFYERYLITLPSASDAALQSYDILVSLYDWDTSRTLPISAATAEVLDNHLRLTAASVAARPPVATPGAGLAVWENSVELQTATCQLSPTGDLVVDLAWAAQRRPSQPAQLFIHVWDGDTLIDQGDLPPHAIPVDAWLPGISFPTTWRTRSDVDAPVVKIGLYDVFSMDRWTITDSPGLQAADNMVELGCVPDNAGT